MVRLAASHTQASCCRLEASIVLQIVLEASIVLQIALRHGVTNPVCTWDLVSTEEEADEEEQDAEIVEVLHPPGYYIRKFLLNEAEGNEGDTSSRIASSRMYVSVTYLLLAECYTVLHAECGATIGVVGPRCLFTELAMTAMILGGSHLGGHRVPVHDRIETARVFNKTGRHWDAH